MVKQSDALEGASDAGLRELGRSKAVSMELGEVHGPRGRTLESARDIERGRLACSVGTDQADDFALGNFEADVTECEESTEPHRHVLEGEHDPSSGGVGHSAPNYSEVRGLYVSCVAVVTLDKRVVS
jgi:hypothetical protein